MFNQIIWDRKKKEKGAVVGGRGRTWEDVDIRLIAAEEHFPQRSREILKDALGDCKVRRTAKSGWLIPQD